MPRQARLDAPGTLHHVMLRGIERRAIVTDDADRQDLVRRLGALANEVLWYGVNHTNIPVGNGVYIYAIHSPEGTLLARDKIAVVR